jgi:uncharacterized protein YdiU (UPF0061 family)
MAWQFDNSYARLPTHFYRKLTPEPVANPELVMVNHALAEALGLDLERESETTLAAWFAGNQVPEGGESIAQAYAGHQYGHFTMLGDGRAHLLGEHMTPDGARADIQLKGSGKTPYGRRGDGRAVLGPMLREYLISESMAALGIPTTRSLAVATTGETVLRDGPLPGAVLTRVSASHLRVGTFEYVAAEQDVEGLKQLADYAIARHDLELQEQKNPYLAWLKAVMGRQIALVTEWMRVGFVHGVMNTDNVAISGETIDYGPCAFMDYYDPATVFSSIDRHGRYAFANQPYIAQWNMARLAEATLPLLHDRIEEAAAMAEDMIQSFRPQFEAAWLDMMRRKLGLQGNEVGDAKMVDDLLQWMHREERDYTETFRDLGEDQLPSDNAYKTEVFQAWHQQWQALASGTAEAQAKAREQMRAVNPAIIPRNHRVEEALQAAESSGYMQPFHELLAMVARPYHADDKAKAHLAPPRGEDRVYQTFCGT